MFCPKCKSSDTSVKKSEKITGREARVHRTRRCNSCGYHFQTTETPNIDPSDASPQSVVAEEAPIAVKKVPKVRSKKDQTEDSDK